MEFVVRGYRRHTRKHPVVVDHVEAANAADAIVVARARNAEINALPLHRIEVLQDGKVVKPKRDESRSARWRRSGAEDHL